MFYKYSELHRLLCKNHCYATGKTRAGHPLWYSPITGKHFTTSHHEKMEVAKGTLQSIKKLAGIN
ncbi:MAG: type II toxin-antitoxin system HicA family toxin [Bacteroidales bacterium]|nr:type II toxin-antitoxin system HicA family toxin [Bacteroidales bacterium]